MQITIKSKSINIVDNNNVIQDVFYTDIGRMGYLKSEDGVWLASNSQWSGDESPEIVIHYADVSTQFTSLTDLYNQIYAAKIA